MLLQFSNKNVIYRTKHFSKERNNNKRNRVIKFCTTNTNSVIYIGSIFGKMCYL